jgi:hypothetical protein
LVCAKGGGDSADDIMRKYPALTAHVICASLGYATPSLAARIVRNAKWGLPTFCEWISAHYGGDSRGAVRLAWLGRGHHRGFMADYGYARMLVDHAIESGKEPKLASWF